MVDKDPRLPGHILYPEVDSTLRKGVSIAPNLEDFSPLTSPLTVQSSMRVPLSIDCYPVYCHPVQVAQFYRLLLTWRLCPEEKKIQ